MIVKNVKGSTYNVYGLNIASEIEISEFLEGHGKADIEIKLGKIPSVIEAAAETGQNYQISRNEFIFYMEDIAHYYVKNGNLIVVEPEKAADFGAVKLYLISTVLGVALQQRGMLSVHGSAVVIDEKCVVFTGASGAGKSTICAALREKGYEFLADDVSVVTLNEAGIPLVQPAFPQQRLCEDTAKAMGYDAKMLVSTCKDDSKYLINIKDKFKRKAVRLKAIVELSEAELPGVKITKITGTDKLKNLIRNIYCIVLLSNLGIEPELFIQCTATANNICFYKLTRPAGKFTMQEQISYIEKVINSEL